MLTGKSAKEALTLVEEQLDPTILSERIEAEKRALAKRNSISIYFLEYIERKENAGTKGLYQDTYKKLQAYCLSAGIDFCNLQFDGINKVWLESFEQFCLKTESQNTASRHLRDLRAVYNAAIDEDKTTCYPFRKFKIKTEETIDKSYTAEELRGLFNHTCYEGGQQEAVDIFKLMFLLIGINEGDLAYASKASKGRLVSIRRSTC